MQIWVFVQMVPIISQNTDLRFHSRRCCHAVRVYSLIFIWYNKEIYSSWQMYLCEPVYGSFFIVSFLQMQHIMHI